MSVASDEYAFSSAGPVSYGSTANRTGLCGQPELVEAAAVAEAAVLVAAALDEVDELDELEPQPAKTSPVSSSEMTPFFIVVVPWSRFRPRGSPAEAKLVKTSNKKDTQVQTGGRRSPSTSAVPGLDLHGKITCWSQVAVGAVPMLALATAGRGCKRR